MAVRTSFVIVMSVVSMTDKFGTGMEFVDCQHLERKVAGVMIDLLS